MPWYAAHFASLTQGLTELDYSGSEAYPILVFGERSFPIATNEKNQVMAAGAEYEKVSGEFCWDTKNLDFYNELKIDPKYLIV